jgi:transposase
MTATQRCSRCGQTNPVKYEAFFQPTEGEVTRRLIICEGCGATMEADEFARLAMRDLSGENGTVEIVNFPADQARRLPNEEMPENQ